MITKESLEKQLNAAENDLEAAKAQVYRCDGIIQFIKHQLSQLDEAEQAEDAPAVESKKKKG